MQHHHRCFKPRKRPGQSLRVACLCFLPPQTSQFSSAASPSTPSSSRPTRSFTTVVKPTPPPWPLRGVAWCSPHTLSSASPTQRRRWQPSSSYRYNASLNGSLVWRSNTRSHELLRIPFSPFHDSYSPTSITLNFQVGVTSRRPDHTSRPVHASQTYE